MPHAPQTPKRSRSTLIYSPYFSPSKPVTPSCYFPSSLCPSSNSIQSETDLETNTDGCFEDPLFCYYFRNFFLAYRRLALLKPALIQVAEDPWKLLVAVTLLNKTSRTLAIPAFRTIMAKWPTPWALSHAHLAELVTILRPLGTYNIRSARLIKLSETYLHDPPCAVDLRPSTPRVTSYDPPASSTVKRGRYPPTPVSHLPGAGQYALDSYRIFCTTNHASSSDEWKAVLPTDKELIRYLRSKWAFVERKEWTPGTGVLRPVSLSYLKDLISELEGAQ